ncbi:MAG: magnesium transporter [Anaerolineales bacterium]|nr:magnesium transporter [Anaerolineales bacterium]
MTIFNTEALLAQIQRALDSDDLDSAIQVLEDLRPADQAHLVGELNPNQQETLLRQLGIEDAADVLEKLEDPEAAELAQRLSSRRLATIADEMEPDEAADLLDDLPRALAADVLAYMESADEIRPLMPYPDDTAGGLMTTDFIALDTHMTVAQALEMVRLWEADTDMVHYLFVTEARQLCGVVPLRRLIYAEPATLIQDLMDPDMISVRVEADQEECAQLMSHYDLIALPVVDQAGHLLGIVAVDDIVDVLVVEATEDIQRLGGGQPLAQSYLNTKISTVTRARIGWLLLLFITGSLTGTVMRFFETELAALVSLSFFIPLLIGTGGNAGSQTTSTIIRAIALGEISIRDGLNAAWHELRVGLLLGVGMSVAAYLRAITWGYTAGLATTVAVAILAIVVWANTIGAVLPLLATRLKIDPTVVSGPVMSTLVDATGLFIYFSIAKLILGV